MSSNGGYSLVHPVYLDVPMMVSFLAHLEGGVSVDEEQTATQSGARERLLKGRAGFRARLGPLGSGDVGAEGSTQRRDEDSLESKTSRHHTAASLFNLLYDYLVEDDQMVPVETPDSLTDLRSGQLVEVTGEYLGNPLEESLTLVSTMLPYLEAQEESEAERKQGQGSSRPPKRSNQRNQSGSGQRGEGKLDEAAITAAVLEEALKQQAEQEQKFGLMVTKQMAADLRDVPVHDVLVRTEACVNAVLTVSSEFYSRTTHEYLRAGEFRVIGKVTRILRDDKVINLTRRTVMGAMPDDTARETMSGLSSAEGLALDLADPIISAPGLQVLPMAIFL